MTADEREATRRGASMPVAEDLLTAGFVDPAEIGRGGFGVVYRCSQPTLDRTVAVKVLTAELDAGNQARFLREQHAMGRLTGHPHIVTVLEAGVTSSGRRYLVMPYYSMDSLDAWIRKHGPVPLENMLSIGTKIAGALARAHEAGIVHRDVKPANILIDEYGEPALTDFGIARMTGEFRTATGTLTGSPAFTAPEVLEGETPTQAADVYGLGATLFCALTGHAAFERRIGENVVTQFLRITTQPVPSLNKDDFPEEVSALVARAMSRHADERPSATELGEAIGRIRQHDRAAAGSMAFSGAHPGERPAPSPQANGVRTPRVAFGQGSEGNLPLELTTFIDRRTETTEIKNLLSSARLVTLTGIGGVGKTRLAMRAAEQARRAFADGVWLVELADLADADLLVDMLAATMGVREEALRPLLDVVLELLSSRELLLLLDNCEHLVEATAELSAILLRACPDLRILATSREQLNVAGESVLQVPPLTSPDPEAELVLAEMPRFDGVALFAERASAVIPGFEIDEDNKSDVARICARLDGLPLAIELAAARMRTMSAEQIVRRLADRYSLLTRGVRTAPTRQQTLRWCVDWSYSLCSPDEQRLWARLSVFANSFTLEAVEQVCFGDSVAGQETGQAPIDMLSSLMDKSIVIRDESDYGVRFRMLETVADYGREKLRESGEEERLRRRHRTWYARLAVVASADWISARQSEWKAKLERELPNLRAALESFLAEDDPESAEAGLRTISALAEFWTFRGLHSEGRAWADRALLNPGARSAVSRIEGLGISSHFAATQGDFAGAADRLELARHYPERDLPPAVRARIEHTVGLIAITGGDPVGAEGPLRRAADLLRSERNSALRMSASTLLGWAFELRGDTDAAERCYREVLAVTEACGESYYRSGALRGMGVIARERGEDERALRLFERALRLNRLLYSPHLTALNLDAMACALGSAGELERAAVLMGSAQGLWPGGRTLLTNLSRFHGECTGTVRAALGERRFEAALRQGRVLGADAALGYALQEHPTPTTPSAASSAGLTKRERQVAGLVAQGLSNRQIAAKLVISQRTAQGHVENILTKLGFNSRTQIAAWIAAADRQKTASGRS